MPLFVPDDQRRYMQPMQVPMQPTMGMMSGYGIIILLLLSFFPPHRRLEPNAQSEPFLPAAVLPTAAHWSHVARQS